MKKSLIILATAIAVLGLVAAVPADACCGGCDKAAKTADSSGAKPGCSAGAKAAAGCDKGAEGAQKADNRGYTCPLEAGKAAHAKALAETGCAKTADEASRNAMAEAAYANTLAETGCAETAARAAHKAVLDSTGSAETADAAYRHTVAKAAYDRTLTETGCAKTAKAASERAAEDAPAIQVAEADAKASNKG